MKLRNLIALLVVLGFCCCSGNETQVLSEKYFGAYIENGPRMGRIFRDSAGIRYFYCYTAATITNDSVLPMNLQIAFSKEYYQPTPINGQKFKVFLQDTPTLSNTDIKATLNAPYAAFSKVIDPKGKCELHIGFLAEYSDEMNPIPFALFSKGHKLHYRSIPDDAVSEVPVTKDQLTLLLGLGFSHTGSDRSYSIIPCGKICFSDKRD